MKQKAIRLFHFSKPSLLISLLFLLYLITLPILVQVFIPCLKYNPLASYQSRDCTVERALDTYMTLALIGFTLAVITIHCYLSRCGLYRRDKVIKKPINYQPYVLTFLFAAILSFMIIGSYLIFIPNAEMAIKRSSIILDSLRK
jgi:hypothetical protein